MRYLTNYFDAILAVEKALKDINIIGYNLEEKKLVLFGSTPNLKSIEIAINDFEVISVFTNDKSIYVDPKPINKNLRKMMFQRHGENYVKEYKMYTLTKMYQEFFETLEERSIIN